MPKKPDTLRKKKKSFISRYAKLIIGFFIGIIFSSVIFIFFKTEKKQNKDFYNDIQMRESGYSFINPLLDCESYEPNQVKRLNDIQRKVNNYIQNAYKSGKALHISVYLRLLNDGPWMGINENHLFTPASLLKVPLMIAFFKKIESQPELLNNSYMYPGTQADKFNQNIVEGNLMKAKSYYPLMLFIENMIIFSDNSAMAVIMEQAGEDMYYKVMQELGADLNKKDLNFDFLSVKEYSSFFRILYNATYLNKEYSEKSLEILSRSLFKEGLPKHLPPDVLIAHKFGERGLPDSDLKQLHDCGIIYQKNAPYLLCVMTKGVDFDVLKGIIADISHIVYEDIAKN